MPLFKPIYNMNSTQKTYTDFSQHLCVWQAGNVYGNLIDEENEAQRV